MTHEPQDSDYREALDRYFYLCRRFRVQPIPDADGNYRPFGSHAADLEILAMREDVEYDKEAKDKE